MAGTPNSFSQTEAGYQVTRPAQRNDRANAIITDNGGSGRRKALLLTGYSADFGLSGATAQSHQLRDFYARNFNQTTFSLAGECANQHEYNDIAEFVRNCQWQALSGTLALLHVLSGEPSTMPNAPTQVSITTGGTRGKNAGFSAYVYVLNVTRGGQSGQFAPTYTLEIVIAQMLTGGVFTEDFVVPRQLKSWTEILKGVNESYITDPDKAAQANLKAKQQVQQDLATLSQDLSSLNQLKTFQI